MHSKAQRRSPCIPLVFLLFVVFAGAARAELPGPFLDAVRNSGLIFRGTVRAVGKSTPTVPTEPRTAVVTVDQILEAPAAVGNVTGREVTVRFREPGRLKAGDSALFFTNVYSAGTSLGLDEVGWLPGQEAAGTEEKIRGARKELADEALLKRLRSARMVVLGTAGEPRPTEAAREPDSEHDPLWWAAPVRVESVLKGDPANGPVIANFPSSIDIVWERSPRLKAGQKGIFLLQPGRGDFGKAEWFKVPGLFLVDPLDLLPPEELGRVRQLLNGPR